LGSLFTTTSSEIKQNVVVRGSSYSLGKVLEREELKYTRWGETLGHAHGAVRIIVPITFKKKEKKKKGNCYEN